MDRVEYLLQAMKFGHYKEKKWVLNVFTVKEWETPPEKPEQLKLYAKDGYYCTFDEKLNKDELIFITEGGKPVSTKKTLFDVREELKLKAFTVPNLTKDVVTTPGVLLINYYCLIYAFGKKVEYVEDIDSPDTLSKLVVDRVVDNKPMNQRLESDRDIYVDEAVKFLSAVTSFSSFAPLNAASATPYTMTVDPAILKERDRLLEENKDKLLDPVVVSNIEKKLTDMDKAYLAKDPNGGFFISPKGIENARKKVHIMNGLNYNMAGKPVFVGASLSEGMKPEDIPTLFDTLRDGSFNRGAMTALGGEEVKFLFRVFNSSKIIGEDCGTKLGRPIKSDEKTLKNFMSRYVIWEGKVYPITEKTIPALIGKPLYLRTPACCQQDKEGRDFCITCMGQSFRGNESALAAATSSIASQMMYIFMKMMHGKVARSVKWEPLETLS